MALPNIFVRGVFAITDHELSNLQVIIDGGDGLVIDTLDSRMYTLCRPGKIGEIKYYSGLWC